MLELSQRTQNFLSYTFHLIDKLARPNPDHFEDKVEYSVTCTRNRSLVIFQCFLFAILCIDSLFNGFPWTVNLGRICLTIFICLLVGTFCKYHPHLFKIFYSVMCMSYGPLLINSDKEENHQIWLTGLVMPLFAYVFTGSSRHFLFQAFVQLIYTNTIYFDLIKRSILNMTVEAFSVAFIDAMNLSLLMVTGLIMLAHYFTQTAYKRISIVEKKKEEAEKQKIFLLGFSHELRNLINSLTGNVKLAGLENLTRRAKELLLNAEVCGELLLHLVNNILDTGKMEIGELEINPTPTRIYDTLERIWGVCSELIRRKNLMGKMTLPKNMPNILKIDHYRLTQIFMNLVGNGIKFTEQGSIDINVEWISDSISVDESAFQPYPFNYFDDYDEGLFEKQKILNSLDKSRVMLDLRTRKVDRSLLRNPQLKSGQGILKVSVTDSGCGMSNDETKKLFQKFSQVSSDVSKRKLGTGLGLFITKQLCQRMEGEVKVFSEKGSGSTFMFCIPAEIVKEERDLNTFETTKSFISSQKLKAMIVDDAPFNQAILKSFYEKLGVEVIDTAANGLEAYEKYLHHTEKGVRPQIVTMDLDMPFVDGKKAAQKIRQIEIERNLDPCFMPIISGNCSDSEIFECLNKDGHVRADTFLKKPATIEEILRATGDHFKCSYR